MIDALLVLPGDGIGPAVVREAVRALRAVGVHAPVEELPFGHGCWLATGEALPERTVARIREVGFALLGAATTPAEGCASPVLELRRRLGLDLLVRPAARGAMDVVVVGHAFEGLYGSVEDEGPPAVTRWVVTPEGARRLLREAFGRARRKVTLVDKPTVLRGAARIFRAEAEPLAREGIAFEVVNADAFVAALLARPDSFDVIAATSFVSDVLSDLTAALAGGVGCVASASLGPGVAVFEPVHGSAPKHAVAAPRVNPTGAILAAAMLLDHVGEGDRADRIRAAVARVSDEGRVRTIDQRGDATTEAFGREVARIVASVQNNH